MQKLRKRFGIATVVAFGVVVLLAHQVVALTLTKLAVRPSGITMVSDDTPFVTGSGVFVDVPTASTTITVPNGMSSYILARFTSESLCQGAGGWCSVRIVLVYPSGAEDEMAPASAYDFAFDSPVPGQPNGAQYESHSVERSSRGVASGTYKVKVQAAVVAGATSLRLDDWHLTIEAMCFAGAACTP